MKVKTKFLAVRSEDVSAIGKNEKGSLFVVFKSGAQHHVKYDDQKECDADWQKLDEAMDSDYGPELFDSEDQCPES